ncbi:MAG: EthD domain-containing protein [Myxococcales bacterium]
MADLTFKHVFLWRPVAGTSLATFAAVARPGLQRTLAGCGATDVWLHITEEPPPRLSPVPYLKAPLALISAKGTEQELQSVAERLRTLPGTHFAWRVDEAVPVVRKQESRPGERVQGACLLTFIRQNPKLTREAFLDEWFNRHTPLALKIHPLACYVRNQVLTTLTPETPRWDGIVTEAFAAREDLTNPRRMFGGTLKFLPNMIRVGLHVSKFLEFSTIENAFVFEYPLDVRASAAQAAA